jgi:hypothetical protein
MSDTPITDRAEVIEIDGRTFTGAKVVPIETARQLERMCAELAGHLMALELAAAMIEVKDNSDNNPDAVLLRDRLVAAESCRERWQAMKEKT